MVPHIQQSKERILKILNETTKSSRKAIKRISNTARRLAQKENLGEKYTSEDEVGDLKPVVEDILSKRKAILEVAGKVETPFFLLDTESLEKDITTFKQNFAKYSPACTSFYAIKCNDHPTILEAVARHGFGMDASSGRELLLAQKFGAKRILFSGPGKTQKELQLAVASAENVIINIDSWGELQKLGRMLQEQKTTMRAGVRVFLPAQETWSKFGIPLTELKKFWMSAKKYPNLKLCGIQFHTSWNKDPSAYVRNIAEIGTYLKQNFTAVMRQQVSFIDFGGGFFPDRTEGFYPWTAHYPNSWPAGKIIKMADAHFGVETKFEDKYYITRSAPIEQFAKKIAAAFKEHIEATIKCEYFTEPGRIIATRAQHIVVRITDCKAKNRVIADGGVNMVGWEYGENFYYPMVNLTHPADKEIPCTVFGPLCTPHDIWGYYVYAKKISDGDLIVIPNQGAYKAVLAQNFIKPIPPLHVL